MLLQEIMFSQEPFKNWGSEFERSLMCSTKLQLFYHKIQSYCETVLQFESKTVYFDIKMSFIHIIAKLNYHHYYSSVT